MKNLKTFGQLFEGAGDYYFDEHDSVDKYTVKILADGKKLKDGYEEHVLAVEGLPNIGKLNTRHSTWEEMLYFVAQYSSKKDDAFAEYVNNLPLSDNLTLREGDREYTFAMSDLSDFSK